MRWVLGIAGLAMLGAGAWLLIQQHQAGPAADPDSGSQATTSDGGILLSLRHDGSALRLLWNPRAKPIRDARHGTLIISDGSHESRLDLDNSELRSGMASYWPESQWISFRLETDSGAYGSLEAEASPPPAASPDSSSSADRRSSDDRSAASPPQPRRAARDPLAPIRRVAPESAADPPLVAPPVRHERLRPESQPMEAPARHTSVRPSRWTRLRRLPLIRHFRRHR